MPTQVERFLDSFLKLDGIEGKHEQTALDSAALKIDDDFLKLSNATPDTFLKLEHDPALKHDFHVIGEAFVKLSSDFSGIAEGGVKIDDLVLKATAGLPSTNSVDGAPDPQADFLKLNLALTTSATDLKILGRDFLKIDTSPDLPAVQVKISEVSDDFLKLSSDMAANGAAFGALSDDFLKLGGVGESSLDFAYKELGGELKSVGSAFDTLSVALLGQAMAGEAGANASGGGGAGKIDYVTVFQDFHKLDSALGGVAPGAAAVVGDLLRS